MPPTGSLVRKDPQSTQWPRGIDWTDYLARIDDAETIAVSAWTITGADAALTKDADSIVTGAKKTQVKLSGGTLGLKYDVTNAITTSSGVHDERSFKVFMENQ